MNVLRIFLVLSACVVTLVVGGRDFYKILDVPKSANVNQIKKAYRKLAKELHPDKNKDDPIAQEKFQLLFCTNKSRFMTWALPTKPFLIPEKRKVYDRSGEEGVNKMGGGGFGGHHHEAFTSFFGDFFGGGHHDDSDELPKGATIAVDLLATLEEVYNGNFVEIRRRKASYKQTSGTRECNCRHEMRAQQLGGGHLQMFQVKVCDECPNVKLVTETKTLEVEIEIGADDGHEQKFIGEGEPHIDGEPGDLVFRLKLEKHKVFERKGMDLYTNVTISLQQALNGFDMNITALDGHQISVKREKITWSGARIRKQGEGMPSLEDNNKRGILYITFNIEFPKGELTEEQKQVIADVLKQPDFKATAYNGLQGY
ncbi:J domain-containing protein [Aphelenchoides bicaudatus]|nr:J domain-containing protein [Aphelenchoides bicaudatus]